MACLGEEKPAFGQHAGNMDRERKQEQRGRCKSLIFKPRNSVGVSVQPFRCRPIPIVTAARIRAAAVQPETALPVASAASEFSGMLGVITWR